MADRLKKFLHILEPYKGILLFLFLLFFFHYLWVLSVDGYIDGDKLYIFGKECTPEWFDTVTLWLAKIVHWFVRLFPGNENFIINGHLLYYPEKKIIISIVWGCTGIKQLFIFTGIMLFYRGPFIKKLWYIPMGWLILSVYNVIRIAIITMITHHHPEEFDFLHNGVFRVIYYAIIFLIWVIWEEFIFRKRNKNGKQKQEDSAVKEEHAG